MVRSQPSLTLLSPAFRFQARNKGFLVAGLQTRDISAPGIRFTGLCITENSALIRSSWPALFSPNVFPTERDQESNRLLKIFCSIVFRETSHFLSRMNFFRSHEYPFRYPPLANRGTNQRIVILSKKRKSVFIIHLGFNDVNFQKNNRIA